MLTQAEADLEKLRRLTPQEFYTRTKEDLTKKKELAEENLHQVDFFSLL